MHTPSTTTSWTSSSEIQSIVRVRASVSISQFVCVCMFTFACRLWFYDYHHRRDSIRHKSHPGVRKVSSAVHAFLFSPFFSSFFFSWNQSLCTLHSEIIHRPSSFVLVLTCHKAATRKSSLHRLARSATPSYTNPYRGRKGNGGSRAHLKSPGTREKEASCQLLRLHRCELSFGNDAGRRCRGLTYWCTVGKWRAP